MLQLDANGVSTVKLYQCTDSVLPVATDIDETVAADWPMCLRNLLIVSIRPERLKRCMERLGSLAQYATVVDSVNGEQLDLQAMEDSGQVRQINQWNRMNRGQVGCFLSHRRAWQQIVDSDHEHGFIIEDDCDLRPSRAQLELIQTALTEAADIAWDVFYIARNPALCVTRKRVRTHVVQVGKTWGLFAYVLTKKAARELLEQSKTINGHPADIFVSCHRKAACIKLGVSPIPFVVVDEKSDTLSIV